MALKPLIYQDPLYQLLREGNVQELNQRKLKARNWTLRPMISATSTAGSPPPASTLPDVIFALPICAASMSQKRAQRSPASMG
jgi:hypothetical protein